jgi:hypothetical protein
MHQWTTKTCVISHTAPEAFPITPGYREEKFCDSTLLSHNTTLEFH